jgi:plastocyanin
VRRLLTAIAVAALLVTGCGGSKSKHVPQRSISVDPGGAANVEASEYRFDPVQVILRGHAGKRPRTLLQIRLTNVGSLPHNLTVLDGKKRLGGTKTIPKGGRATAILTLPKREYEYVCTVGDHAKLGMKGKLLVN